MLRVPNKAVWVATGNNPVLSQEMARRTVRIRMDAKLDRAWLRDGFKYPNLREYVARERGKLVWCALVLIQDWIARGRPESKAKPLGSFESWSKVIGGILELAGFSDFLGNVEELYEQSDAEGNAWRQFIGAWWELYEGKEVGVGDLHSIIIPATGDPLDIDLPDKNEKSQKIRLGKLLVQMRDRQFDGKRIIKGNPRNNAQQWKLEPTK